MYISITLISVLIVFNLLDIISVQPISGKVVSDIDNFEKLEKSKFSKKDSENKFSDTFKIFDFEVFDEFSSGKRGYSKSSIDNSYNLGSYFIYISILSFLMISIFLLIIRIVFPFIKKYT